MSTAEGFKYDVALSFLNPDLPTAHLIRNGLAPALRVFLYTDRQQELAATDGLESFRCAFLKESLLVVVLFRSGWGQTSWTRVEQQAIEERFLKDGPVFLFFVMLDRESAPPPWLPTNKIRFYLDDYGVDQAIGAIKLRLQELGTEFHEETLAERAARSARIAKFHAETRRLWRSYDGVDQAKDAAKAYLDIVEQLAVEIGESAAELNIKVGRNEICVALKGNKASLATAWDNNIINDLSEASVVIRIFSAKIILPGEQLRYIGDPPRPTNELRFVPERIEGVGWSWKSGDDKVITSNELAKYAIKLFLDEVERKAEKT